MLHSTPRSLTHCPDPTVQWPRTAYSKTSNNGPSEIKADNHCTTDRSLAPNWFYHRTNTFRTSKKRKPNNGHWWAPDVPYPNRKLPPKSGQCRLLSLDCAPPSLNSKTGHYIRTSQTPSQVRALDGESGEAEAEAQPQLQVELDELGEYIEVSSISEVRTGP